MVLYNGLTIALPRLTTLSARSAQIAKRASVGTCRASVGSRAVSRTVHLTAMSPHPVGELRAAFAERDYWRARLELYAAGAPTLDALSTAADGTTTVEITMRFGGEQLPAMLRPLRLGSLTIVQRERWEPAVDELRGTVDVIAPRTPISGHGDVQLTGDGDGTRLAGTAIVEVRVPLIGGPVAAFLTDMLADGIRDIVRVTDRWLDRRS